jgi:hypothetical protein
MMDPAHIALGPPILGAGHGGPDWCHTSAQQADTRLTMRYLFELFKRLI